MRDRLHKILVDAIIGDIPTVHTFSPDDQDEDNLEDYVSEEEIAEIEEQVKHLRPPTPEEQEELAEKARVFGAWAKYYIGMKACGRVPLDWYEWTNMQVKPTAPEVPNEDESR